MATDSHPFDRDLQVRRMPGHRVRLTYAASTSATVAEIETYLAYRAATMTVAASGQSFRFRSRDDEPVAADVAGPRFSFRLAQWRPIWRVAGQASEGPPPSPQTGATQASPREVRVVADIEVNRQRYDGVDPRGFDAWALIDHLRPQVFNQSTSRPEIKSPGY